MGQTQAQQRLKEAAEEGDINGLYSCIKEDPRILDGIDDIPFVDSPLHTAASAGHTHFALEMMNLKPSFTKKLNPEGLTPLDLALRNGYLITVRRLVNFDKELIRVKGREMLTPLHHVAEKGHIDLLAEFLCACPESITDLTIRDETAVHIAVKNFQLQAFKVLLGWLRRTQRLHVLNQDDEEGNSVLHIAASTLQPQACYIFYT
ncbi:Ankyrin repeat-containing protein BDA1 [Camellia lanceoleosa]|uniref:Ankyrin repeat-containing protein BDA1 n=1 Tax=Camellia lanceoleosa TaxID=1840588 RepID=A0ACC0FI85_9ERIC|nr:Ankyrin repeat-containing protein BDA1 [Camellia lanceoleosa]